MKRDPLGTMLTNTYTKDGLLRRLRLLRSYLEKELYSEGEERLDLSAFLKSRGESESDTQAMTSWGVAIQQAFTKNTLYSKITELRKSIDMLPTVTLFVPFLAREEDVERLARWLREHVDKQAVIDCRFDPDAAGGCRIAYDGDFADYSASYYIKTHPKLFIDLLKQYDTK